MSGSQEYVYAEPATPNLDESVWLAWKEKNRLQDQVRAASRKRVAFIVAALGAAGLAAFVMFGAA